MIRYKHRPYNKQTKEIEGVAANSGVYDHGADLEQQQQWGEH